MTLSDAPIERALIQCEFGVWLAVLQPTPDRCTLDPGP